MRGRKPKIDGPKRGHHKKGPALPPAPPGAPECPENLGIEAKREWNRLCGELLTLNRLSPVYRAALEGAARAQEQIVRIQTDMDEARDASERTSLSRLLNQYLGMRLRHLAEMGLTPVSRARAKDEGGKQADPFDTFLRSGGDLN